MAAYTAEGVALRLRNYLYDHIQRPDLHLSRQDADGRADPALHFRCGRGPPLLCRQAIGIGRIILLFVINFVAICSAGPAAGAGLGHRGAGRSSVVSVFFFKRISKAYEKYQEQEAMLSTTLQENLSGVRVVKAFARQDYEKRKVREGELGEVPAWAAAGADARALLADLGYLVRRCRCCSAIRWAR